MKFLAIRVRKLSHKAGGEAGSQFDWTVLYLRRDLLVTLSHGHTFGSIVGWIVLDVAIESGLSAIFPIRRIIGIDAWPAAQPAEEDMLRRIDHDTHVTRPNHQVSGLGMLHPAEVVTAVVKIGRTLIRIRKPGLKIYGVHQVRAVSLTSLMGACIQSCGNNRLPIILA